MSHFLDHGSVRILRVPIHSLHIGVVDTTSCFPIRDILYQPFCGSIFVFGTQIGSCGGLRVVFFGP